MTSSVEETTGIGIDACGFSQLRAHCIEDWDAVITVEPTADGLLFMFSDEVHLDRDRATRFAKAILKHLEEAR